MELCFFEPSLKIEIGFRKLGVQRIKEMLSLVFGLWAFLPFSYWEIIIKRFNEPGFRVYSISVNLMLELNSL